MTPHQAQRDQKFEEQTNREIEDGRRAASVHRQAVGDGVATDGSQLFFVPASTDLPPNHGHNPTIERQQYTDVLDSASAGKKPPQKKPPPIATKPAPTAKKLPPITTTCAIKGCTFGTVLHANHKCYNKCG
jgi:hypothetical protein